MSTWEKGRRTGRGGSPREPSRVILALLRCHVFHGRLSSIKSYAILSSKKKLNIHKYKNTKKWDWCVFYYSGIWVRKVHLGPAAHAPSLMGSLRIEKNMIKKFSELSIGSLSPWNQVPPHWLTRWVGTEGTAPWSWLETEGEVRELTGNRLEKLEQNLEPGICWGRGPSLLVLWEGWPLSGPTTLTVSRTRAQSNSEDISRKSLCGTFPIRLVHLMPTVSLPIP